MDPPCTRSLCRSTKLAGKANLPAVNTTIVILAKVSPDVPLRRHSDAVATATATVLNSDPLTDRLRAAGLDIRLERLQRLGRLVGQYHDTGKANPAWQTNVHTGTQPPHSHLSALYTLGATLSTDDWVTETEQIAAVVAVLHHHTGLTARNMAPVAQPLRDLTGNPFDAAFEANLEQASFDPVPITDDHVQRLRDSLDRYRSASENLTDGTAELATTLYAALRQADQFVSATDASPEEAGLPILEPESLSLYESLRPFQQRVQETLAERLVGIAGCGEGKTHTALQW
ncbi:MAG: CRISPR-associated endonuclease Cas3'', partial [Halobaculum sp.]